MLAQAPARTTIVRFPRAQGSKTWGLCYGDRMKASAAPSPFERAYPSYDATRSLDELRAREYPALAALDCTYLDYTAANLYATSQLERHFSLLRDHLFGNPHSTSPTSLFSSSGI